LGGVLGGFSIAPFADKYGRKNALAFVTIPLAVGALISAVSWDAASMTFGRLITGIGVGASSQIVPLYLAEISPPSFRGTANGLRRMAYVFGCLAAFRLAVPLEEAANGGDGWWRPLFSDSVFPAVATVVFGFSLSGGGVGRDRVGRGGGIAGVVVSDERGNRVRSGKERD